MTPTGWTDSMSWPNRFSSIFTSHTCAGIEYGKPISGSGSKWQLSYPDKGEWMLKSKNFDFMQEMWIVQTFERNQYQILIIIVYEKQTNLKRWKNFLNIFFVAENTTFSMHPFVLTFLLLRSWWFIRVNVKPYPRRNIDWFQFSWNKKFCNCTLVPNVLMTLWGHHSSTFFSWLLVNKMHQLLIFIGLFSLHNKCKKTDIAVAKKNSQKSNKEMGKYFFAAITVVIQMSR